MFSEGRFLTVLCAKKSIKKGEELFFDYDLTGEISRNFPGKYPFIKPKKKKTTSEWSYYKQLLLFIFKMKIHLANHLLYYITGQSNKFSYALKLIIKSLDLFFFFQVCKPSGLQMISLPLPSTFSRTLHSSIELIINKKRKSFFMTCLKSNSIANSINPWSPNKKNALLRKNLIWNRSPFSRPRKDKKEISIFSITLKIHLSTLPLILKSVTHMQRPRTLKNLLFKNLPNLKNKL